MRKLHLVMAVVATTALAAGVGAPSAEAEPSSPPGGSGSVVPLDAASCDAWEINYRLAPGTRFKITDTLMRAGDGTYDVGPGSVKIRFRDVDGKPGPGTAELLKLEVVTKFTVESNVVGMKTKVTTDAISKNTPGKCGVVATGRLDGNTLGWRGAASGYRSDGKLYCEGTMCGKMGAPPKGESSLTMGPYPVTYRGFLFDADLKKFLMPFSEVARSDKPKQVTHLQMVGVETSRKCVKKPACK